MTTFTQWQDQIDQACAETGVQQVDLILDQAGMPTSVVRALEQLRPEVPWFSLFTGTPEENLLAQAPILMRLDLTQWRHKAWLEELVTYCAGDARVMVVISPLSFQTLGQALRSLAQMKWGGQDGVLRYYDPRIFPLLMGSILTDEQRAEYRQLAFYWSWLDRDAQPQWLRGHGPAEQGVVQVSPWVVLSDAQCDQIGAIYDAQKMLNSQTFDYLQGGREQRFSRLYAWALHASQHNYFGDLTEYVRQRL